MDMNFFWFHLITLNHIYKHELSQFKKPVFYLSLGVWVVSHLLGKISNNDESEVTAIERKNT